MRIISKTLVAAIGAITWSQTAAAQTTTTTTTDPPTTTTTTAGPAPANVVLQQAAPPPTTVIQQPAPVVQQVPVGTTQTTSANYLSPTPHDEVVNRNMYIPNVPLITTGAILFGVPWTASAITSGESNHQGDNHLWIPVAGPWMDFADRGSLPQNGGHDGEVFNRVMLAGDGVLQAIGVLQIAGGLLFPMTRDEKTVTTSNTSFITVTPMRLSPYTYGMGAVGLF